MGQMMSLWCLKSAFYFLYCTFQGMLLAKDIRDRERGGRADVKVIEGEAESNSPQSMGIMNGALGERSAALKDGPPDEVADQEQKSKLTLYQWAASWM